MIPIAPIVVVGLNVIARTATIIVAVNVISTTAVKISETVPQLKQGWREARRQRQLLKHPRLTHNKEFDHGI